MLPAYMLTVSALPMSDSDNKNVAITGRVIEHPTSNEELAVSDATRPPYLLATDVLRPGEPGARATSLRFFHSFYCDANVASRSFCSRCGSPVGFHYRPRAEYFGEFFQPPDGWEDVVDVLLGTVDKFCLNRDEMQVEHDMSWSDALDWCRKQILNGRSDVGARHPSSVLGETI